MDVVEAVARLAGALGLNEVRVRWKLLRLQQQLARSQSGAKLRVEQMGYAHKSCRSCGAVADGAEQVCPRCGGPLASRAAELLRRVGLVLPVSWSFSALLAVAFAFAYARMMAAEPGGGILSFSSETLLGAGALWPPALEAQPWRLGTAMFLHIGLLHLGFNVMALLQIGPTIEHLYGRFAMLALFLVTGIAANVASVGFGLSAVQAGASGGLMGLTGVAAGWGMRDGTTLGREVRNRMLQWGAYTIVFGAFVGADNTAHAGGFVAGMALGALVRPTAWERFGRTPVAIPLAALVLLATLGLAALTLLPRSGAALLGAPAAGDVAGGAARLEELAPACARLAAGDAAGAEDAVRATRLFAPLREEQLPALCEALAGQRALCARVRADDWSGLELQNADAAPGEVREFYRRFCAPAR